MRQRRIYQFLANPTRPVPSGTSFLDLPYKIRYRIYDEALVPMDTKINLSYRGRRKKGLESSGMSDSTEDEEPKDDRPIAEEDEFVWTGLSITFNLLQVSRAIYDDITSILFSTNTIMIRRRDLGSLQPLQNLRPKCLASLTSLVVRLNFTSCEYRQECRKSGRNQPLCNLLWKDDEPLGRTSRADKEVIREWQRTAARLASHIQPHRLSIEFICDTQDYETAKEIVAPFWQLPRLKSCAIRLNKERNPILRQLAEEAAFYSTNGFLSAHFSSPFRFSALPEELQIRILRFTDLITPSEVEWRPHNGFKPRRLPRHCMDYTRGCWCRRYHAAFSPRCKCWEPPSALFLVSQTMRRCALEIFYSRHQFILDLRGGRREPVNSTPERVEASLFLRDVMPASAIRHLRSLEIVFPPFEGDFLPAESAGYRDWRATISLLTEHANLPQLALRILMTNVSESHYLPYRKEGMTRGQMKIVWRVYGRALLPLASLQRPKDLFIHLTTPANRYARNLSDEQLEFRRNEIAKLQRILEQRIMGEDYDSKARGKYEQRTWENSENARYWGSDDDEYKYAWEFNETF